MSERDDDATNGTPVDDDEAVELSAVSEDEAVELSAVSEDEAVELSAVSEDEARAIDSAVRALRDEPVEGDRLTRMRVGLDALIAAQEEGERGGGGAPVARIESHRRWRGRSLAAAAALAAAVLLALMLSRGSEQPSVRQPLEVADDVPRVDVPELPIFEEPEGETPGVRIADESVLPEPSELDALSDEELAVAIEYERLADYDVIAQLELLELLDEMEAVGSI